MKKLVLIILALIVLGVLGYVIFYLISSDKRVSSVSSGQAVKLSENQRISEWRVEDRTGVSAETGLMKSWPESGPELIWSNAELPKGYSSVSFGNNTVYVTGNDGQNDILVALDTYGKIKWKTTYGRSWTSSNPESRSTPTVEEERVYVSSGYGDIDDIVNTIFGKLFGTFFYIAEFKFNKQIL
jgi:hypothetical protein